RHRHRNRCVRVRRKYAHGLRASPGPRPGCPNLVPPGRGWPGPPLRCGSSPGENLITGAVNANLEARLQLVVQTASGQSETIEAVSDTGFNGFLTLPPALIGMLSFPWLCHTQGYLADGSVHDFDVYGATILWDGHLRTVETEAVDAQPLVGM